MFNWFKKKEEKDKSQNEEILKAKSNSNQNPGNQQQYQHGSNGKNVSGKVDFGSCTLANTIYNIMPKGIFPQLNKAKLVFNDNIVSIEIGEDMIRIKCQELGMELHGQIMVGSYSVVTQLNNGKELYEEVLAYGNEAMKVYFEAAHIYVASFLYGYLAAIFGMFDEGYSLENEKGENWHVSLGNYLIQGKLEEMEMPESQLFDIIQPKLDKFQAKMTDDIYGIKIYMSQSNGNQFIGDCRMDNVEWEEGVNELKDKDYPNWVKSDLLMSKKQWIFLKKCSNNN